MSTTLCKHFQLKIKITFQLSNNGGKDETCQRLKIKIKKIAVYLDMAE